MNRLSMQFAVAGAMAALAGCAANPTASTTTFGPAPRDGAQAEASARQSVETAAPTTGVPGAALAQETAGAAIAKPSPVPAVASHDATPATGATPTAGTTTATATATGTPFSTRHASYEPASFATLPGWRTDDLAGSWDAFRRSCAVLGTKHGWSEPCNASRGIDPRNDAAIRRFFEANFNVYQIRNVDQSSDGTMTGYYEPLLNGSRQYGGPYVYAVYGVPADMLYLDARRLAAGARDHPGAARVEGRTVIPLAAAPAAGTRGVYTLDLLDSVPDIRDKKIRLRIDGDRLVPYYSRAEIESGAAKAPILAYVDDPVMLYSMQLQGAGKIAMRDGTIRRFAYAEQNGRPFLPPVAHAGASGAHHLKVRGVDMDIDVANDDTASATPADDSGGFAPATASGDGDADEGDAPRSPLLRGFKLAAATPSTAGSTTPAVAGAARVAGTPAGIPAGTPVTAPHRTFAISDPSYVFFRAIPDSPNGPTGALGVPLSAGRSVAVDPRTTPLGAPVFVATRDDPHTPGAVDRLMMAQDAGGAIRGAVRADYFFGFGGDAQAEAGRTKERLRMWLLLPKGLHVAAQDIGLKTRGAPGASTADCVVSDPDLCVDDDSP